MRKWVGSRVALALGAVCVPALSFGVTDALDVGLRKCAGEADQARRLACFDALAAALPKVEADKFGMTVDIDQKRAAANKKAAAQSPSGAAGMAARTSGTANAGSSRGTTGATTAASAAAPGSSGAEMKPVPPANTLTAKIVSVRENAHGLLVFSLDNNQVWIQDQPSSNIRFAAGESVRIEHGALTSLWLAADHGRKTKVKRLS